MSPAAAQPLSEFEPTVENRPSMPTPVDLLDWVVADRPQAGKTYLPNDNSDRLNDVTASTQANTKAHAPRAVLVSKYEVKLPAPSFEVRQQWEGTVREVSDVDFVAVLSDLSDPSQGREQATFSLDEVPDEDREFVVPGGVFYWSIGYERARGGQKKSTSLIRFRRLPAWTTRELEAVSSEARDLLNHFGSDDPETRTARSR